MLSCNVKHVFADVSNIERMCNFKQNFNDVCNIVVQCIVNHILVGVSNLYDCAFSNIFCWNLQCYADVHCQANLLDGSNTTYRWRLSYFILRTFADTSRINAIKSFLYIFLCRCLFFAIRSLNLNLFLYIFFTSQYSVQNYKTMKSQVYLSSYKLQQQQ